MKYENRADLLIDAGNSIKMQEKAGIIPRCKCSGNNHPIMEMYMLNCDVNKYEFPLAVVEGKPVFVGDELYDWRGERFVITETIRGFDLQPEVSWLPPKSRTVMVELLRDDAEEWARQKGLMSMAASRLVSLCIKALEAK